jgi:anti-sigma factor RsiW
MNCEEIRGGFPQYLEGDLTGDDLKKFEEHLRRCEACRLELEHAREMDALLKKEAFEYWNRIEPDPSFVSRLERSGPWAAPKRAFSLKEWLFAPRQSRHIVNVALSTVLVVSLALLIPRAFMLQTGYVPEPAPAYESGVSMSAAEGMKGGSDVAPTPIPTPATAPRVAPAPAPPAVPTPCSGMGTTTTSSFEIASSPWKLHWWAVSETGDRVVIRVMDAQTGLCLSEAASLLEPQSRIDNEIYVYDKTGEMYLSITAADGTEWEIEVLKNP